MTALRRPGNVTVRFWLLALALLVGMAALFALAPAAEANSPSATPASVTITRTGNTITVVWDTPTGATKYHATYSSDGGNSWSVIGANLPGPGASFGNADPTKTYIVAVRAGNDHGWSGWRNSAPIQPDGSTAPPSAPSNINVSRGNGTLSVSGYSVNGATKYHITYSSNNGGSWNAAPCGDNCTSTTTTISNVDNQKTYIVSIRASNDSGWSGWRNSATIGRDIPATPASVNVRRGDGTLAVSAYSVSNATSYHITYSSNNGANWNAAPCGDTCPALGVTISGVDNAKTYIVAVRAVNYVGWGGWRTSAASGPYGPQPPATPASVSVSRGNGTLSVSGYGVDDATKYHITYSADGGNNWNAAPCGNNCTGASTTISGVDNAKAYIVAVRAGNDNGWSGWRNSAASGPSQPPAAPASVTTERVCGDKFTVTWAPSSGATGYDLNYSTDNRKSWKRALSNEPHAVWIFAVWSKNKTYTLAVRARNSAGVSGWTNSAAAPPPSC